jgi:D-alanyl-D-alanine carboxypeptidase
MNHYHPKHERVTYIALFGSLIFSSVVIVLCSVLLTILYGYPVISQKPSQHQKDSSLTFTTTAFEQVPVSAKAYVVYDLLTGTVIASSHATDTLPLASITKVMTAVTAVRHKDAFPSVVITPDAIEGGYDLGLKKGQVWNLDELLKYTLVFSSNDGAHAVAKNYKGSSFVDVMNTEAKNLKLGLTFTDPAGLDEHGKIGGLGSALDVAKLFGVALQEIPDILDATTKKRQNFTVNKTRIVGIPNTNQEIELYPGAEGSKTGFTDLAGGNLGVVVDVTLGRPVVIVVLGSTREGRFRDVQALYTALIKSVQ